MKALSALATLGLGLMLSACQVVGPDYQLPADAAVQRKDAQGELAAGNRDVVSAPVPSDWWRLYQDPRLDQLVQQALAFGGALVEFVDVVVHAVALADEVVVNGPPEARVGNPVR